MMLVRAWTRILLPAFVAAFAAIVAPARADDLFEVFAQTFTVTLQGSAAPTPEVLDAISRQFVEDFNEVSKEDEANGDTCLIRLVSMKIVIGSHGGGSVTGIARQVGTYYGGSSDDSAEEERSALDDETMARLHAKVVEHRRRKKAAEGRMNHNARRLAHGAYVDDLEIVALEPTDSTEEDEAVLDSVNAQAEVSNLEDLVAGDMAKVDETEGKIAAQKRRLAKARRQLRRLPEGDTKARESKKAEIAVLKSDLQNLFEVLAQDNKTLEERTVQLREARRRLRKAKRIANQPSVREGFTFDEFIIKAALEFARQRQREKNKARDST